MEKWSSGGLPRIKEDMVAGASQITINASGRGRGDVDVPEAAINTLGEWQTIESLCRR